MSCRGRAEGSQQKSTNVLFPLYCGEDRASLRAAPSLWQTEPGRAQAWLSACLYSFLLGIDFGGATRSTSQAVSLFRVLFGRAGLTGWFGEAPTLLGESSNRRLAGFCRRAVQWTRSRQTQLLHQLNRNCSAGSYDCVLLSLFQVSA